MAKHNFEYVVAAINLNVTSKVEGEGKAEKKPRKKSARKPDGKVRSSTKLVLIVLANHRNNGTGQCNPSHALLKKETGYSKRTIVFELQALKEMGMVDWKHGWGNEHAKQSNRYVLNLLEIQRRGESDESEVGTEESAVGADESAVGAMKVHSTTDESAARAPLTSKEPPIIKPPKLEPSALTLGTTLSEMRTSPTTAGTGETSKLAVSAPDALSYASAPDAHSSDEPFHGVRAGVLVQMLPYKRGMELYSKYKQGTEYENNRADIIAEVLEHQKTQHPAAV